MSSVESTRRASELKKHQKEMRNLQSKNKNELETLKLRHDKHKVNVKSENRAEIDNIHSEHKLKVLNQTLKNEEVLTKLKNNLDQVKQKTEEDINFLRSEHKETKKLLNQKYDIEYQTAKSDLSYKLSELDKTFQNQLNSYQKQNAKLASQLRSQNNYEQQKIIATGKKTNSELKQDYFKQKFSQEQKYDTALQKQRVTQENTLVENERKHQRKISANADLYLETEKNLSDTHQKRMHEKKMLFEKKFNHAYKKQSDLLQNLVGKKEKLLHRVKNDLKAEYRLGLQKQNDPFYQKNSLAVNITPRLDEKGYEVKIPVAPHEAKYIKLMGEKRTLTISMDRRVEFTSENQSGGNSTMKKFETYKNTYPVEFIINPDTIQRNYADGFLTFKIDYA